MLLDRPVIYVTGKGGVGKTTVAAAIGLAAAERGRRTIVCEVAEQDTISRAFKDAGVSRDRETELAPDLYGTTIDPQIALEEWLSKQLGGGPLFRTLARSSAFQYFVAAAPGAKELITIAKVWELAQPERWTKKGRTYDTVVVDAPASGHGLAMLTTPATFGDIARVGPIRRQAYKVRDMLGDPEKTAYVAVALPEEMPVNETFELQDKLRDAVGVELSVIVANAVHPPRFDDAEAERVRAVAARNGAVATLDAALAADDRARSQAEHVARLRAGARAPVAELPFLFEDAVGLESYRRLATDLLPQLP